MTMPQIPGLRITSVLGSGGFGVVYQAHQPQIDREVAVKVDNRVLSTDDERDKFLREARAAGRLSGHPHVVSVFDAGVAPDGRPYIVMELCSGGSLGEIVQRQGPLPISDAVDIGLKLADALGHAHASGVLHRDIKPANVLVDGFGAVKLADFGLAAILDAQSEGTVTLGALSPAFAAPEAFAWSAPSPAADVYSLAATIYALATGRSPRNVPWPADSLDQLATAFRGEVEPIPGAPPNVNAALIRALATDTATRTPSARLFADELRGAVPVPSRPKRRRWVWPAAVVALAVVAAGVYFLIPPATSTPGAVAPPGVTAPTATPPPKLQVCDGSDSSGYCVTEACFGGPVITANRTATASNKPCAGEHSWEAFSGGWLPEGAMDLLISEVAQLPEVAKACDSTVMKNRTKPDSDTSGWRIMALPTTLGTNGRGYFYCLAAPAEGGVRSSRIFTSG
jgi:hypothetical protein